MLQDNKDYNQTVKPNSLEIELLKQHFPQYFNKDGEFLISKFEQNLTEEKIDFNKESFGLNFLGKSLARYVSSTKTETYVAPHTEYNTQDLNKDSENAYIIGDNLDALKHLLGSYTNKIKCIYIDPPYNTGSDGFVYNDSFEFTVEKLSDLLDITEEEAQRIIDLKGKSNHSAWLTFIYPRLVLARYLLSDDGVIFISIDDNEQANLKEICDEIFGEDNFVGDLIRKTKSTTNDVNTGFNIQHESCLCYAKNKSNLTLFGGEKDLSNYRNLDNDPNGPWISDNPTKSGYAAIQTYPIVNPYTGKIDNPPQGRSWIFTKNTIQKHIDAGRICFKKEHKENERGFIYKRYLKDLKNLKEILNSLDFSDNSFMNQVATKELKSFDLADKFSFPKPIGFVKKLVLHACDQNDIIVDFFSGSATTAHAVMQLNAEDGGNRKFIMVQLPEQISEDKPAFKDGYRTIDEIGRKRIEVAAKKIKEETNADIDYGFKVYSLYQEPKNTISQQEEFNPSLEFKQESIEDFRTEVCSGKDAALTTYMLLDGYGLNTKPEPYKLDTYIAQKIQDTLYILEDGVSSDDLAALIERIEAYQIEINRIVIFHASLDFNQLRELKTNLSCLRHNRHIKLVERY